MNDTSHEDFIRAILERDAGAAETAFLSQLDTAWAYVRVTFGRDQYSDPDRKSRDAERKRFLRSGSKPSGAIRMGPYQKDML